MLVLTRKLGESIRIGEHIVITICRINTSNVRVGIEAPQEMRVTRNELPAKQPAAARTEPGS